MIKCKTDKKQSLMDRHAFFNAKSIVLTLLLGTACGVYAQSSKNDDDKMIDQFINAKGYSQTIVFSPNNIKQFWIDKTVISQDNTIQILLNNRNSSFESVPLRIKLAHVDETLDCKVDVISTSKDLSFNVLDSANKSISSSSSEDDFIDYSLTSTRFHLEDTQDSAFKLLFSSTKEDIVSIKKIVLSFEDNKQSSYMKSPGKMVFSKDSIKNPDTIVFDSDGAFSKTGVYNNLLSSKYILIKDNTLVYSAKVKNTGTTPSKIYAGYTLLAKGNITLDGKNFPYKGLNNTAAIVSAQKGSHSIVVDSLLDGTKDCFLSLDAKEDLSDIPSFSFANGKIVSIKQLNNGQEEITMSEPLKKDIAAGTKCRINGRSGSQFYLQRKDLQPGESCELSFEVKMDQSHHFYSGSIIPSGVYCVQPILYSHSKDTKVENSVKISEFTISY